MVEPFERMVADPVEFYRRLAAFCGARGSYEQPAPSRRARLFLGQALERLVVTRAEEELRQCAHGREPEQVGVSATAAVPGPGRCGKVLQCSS
jgi:hypothetical protein